MQALRQRRDGLLVSVLRALFYDFADAPNQGILVSYLCLARVCGSVRGYGCAVPVYLVEMIWCQFQICSCLLIAFHQAAHSNERAISSVFLSLAVLENSPLYNGMVQLRVQGAMFGKLLLSLWSLRCADMDCVASVFISHSHHPSESSSVVRHYSFQ